MSPAQNDVMKNEQVRILFLAASPKTLQKLDLDGEYEAIEEKLNNTPHATSFLLQHRWKIGRDQLLELLLMFRPHIVHMSGHGTEDNLILQDRDGNPWMLDRKMARDTFKTMNDTLKLIVFNACYSRDVAEDVSEVIDCVIGMALPVRDSSAIAFSSALYRGIGSGLSLRAAYDQARTQIVNSGLTGPKIPQILSRPGVDPRQIFPLQWLPPSAPPTTPAVTPSAAPANPATAIPTDRPGLRNALQKHLPSDGQFEQFVVDYFEAVHQRFSGGMDRTARTNLLFTMQDAPAIASALESHIKISTS